MPISSEQLYAHALNILFQGRPRPLQVLREQYGSFEDAWKQSINAWQKFLKIQDPQKMKKLKSDVDLKKEQKIFERENISVILAGDHDYPEPLSHIYDHPTILYIKGRVSGLENALGVVGTRRTSSYGRQACETIVRELARNNITIVSGLAVGIDTIAHTTTLAVGGLTIAVLGSGISYDAIYPAVNKKLTEKIIASGGALVSEYPPTMKGELWTFPLRNRIIAGLSRGVLVVEAPIKSGALITSECAVECGRDVFAVPGDIFSTKSEGTNTLLKRGAAPATSANDIFDAWNISVTNNTENTAISEREQKILSALEEPLTIDDVSLISRMTMEEILQTVGELELRGIIKISGGKLYKTYKNTE